ncbi:hypothetical protein NPIL_107671 [Nephila pilipes]|uniref:Uncharacterized protein n=1 Tax=Nephila pilipes TaxID=299642 RepID=A0A8X6TZQ3_NEPPI|nr:hypothetical protein NPIL_107671 [Nephila pilipes]
MRRRRGRNERGEMPPRKSVRMGWMAGKEHSSGSVIQAHSPNFFLFLLLPTLGQMLFTDGKQRPFSDRAREFSTVPSEAIPVLISPIRRHFRLPSLYKSRLRHEPSHSMHLRSSLATCKMSTRLPKWTFSTKREMPTPF